MSLSTPPSTASRGSLDRVFDALDQGGYKPEKRAETFMALCPVHEDRTRSLSVKYDRRNESVLLHCFGCEAQAADVTAALGMKVQDLFDRPLPDRPREQWSKSKGSQPANRSVAFRSPKKTPPRLHQPAVADLSGAKWERSAVYSYTDAAGTVVQEVVREQADLDGVTHKRFTQRFMGAKGNLVSRKPPGFSPVLYNLSAVLSAIATHTPVWLVEGEKDADNAISRELVATTNAQGAGSFPDELADVLAAGAVNIVIDRDLAGYKRATSLRDLLEGKGARVRLLLPATTEDKSDLSDHFDAGHTVADLIEISVQDAAALTQLAEARKAAVSIETAWEEAAAQKALAVDDDAHLENAQTWARYADAHFRALEGTTGGSSLLADSFGPEGKKAIAAIKSVVDDAAKTTADAHKVADLPVPEKLQRRLARADATVVNIGGRGEQPPAYRGNDFVKGDRGGPNEGTRYIVRRGETVQLKYEKDGEETRPRFIRIMLGWAEVLSTAVEDDGIESEITRSPHKISVRFCRWVRDDNDQPVMVEDPEGSGKQVPQIEEAIAHWSADEVKDGSWAQKIPLGGKFFESSSRRGKDAAWDAIFGARPAPSAHTTVYTATGWRRSDVGSFFVHGDGGIAKSGTLPLDVDLPDVFRVYRLPEPTTEAKQLRAAWEAATLPLVDELPARVIAPLLGVVWESVFQRVPTITHLVGARASFKSSIARLAMQYVAPDLEHFGRKEVLSGANQGGTEIGLIRALRNLRNLPVLIDDLAPDGDAKRAQKKLSNLARAMYNGIERVTGKQRGGIAADAPVEASVITTGELTIGGSGQTRLLAIPIDPGSITGGAELMASLERRDRREARGLLGASLIQWLAQHRDDLITENEDDTSPGSIRALTSYWRERLSELPHDRGVIDRLAGAAASSDHGIKLMLRMLVTSGAMSPAGADAFYKWAAEGIHDAIAMQDAGSGDPAEQMLEYLREAVTSGAGHFTSDKGNFPEDPDSRGWSERGKNEWATWNPNGSRLGVIKGEGDGASLLLFPSVVLGVVNNVAQRADETFSETAVSIGSALAAHGWLTPDSAGRYARPHRLGKSVVRAWEIPLSVFDGLGGTSTGDDDETPEPTLPPSLFDMPGASPLADPDTDPQAPTPTAAPATPATPAPAATTKAPPAPTVQQGAPAMPTPPAPTDAPREAPAAAQRRSGKNVARTFRASLAVLHTDGVWLPSGECVQPSHPITHLGDVAQLVAELGLGTQNGWKTEDGQLLVTEAAAIELGIPVDKIEGVFERTDQLKALTKDHPFAQRALDAGYRVGNDGKYLNTTTRVWHNERPELRARFVLMSTLKDDFQPIVDDNPDAATIARRLQKFADALHAPYAVSVSTTGLDLLASTAKTKELREIYYSPSRPVPPATNPSIEADIDWQRKPTETESGHRYLHAYDRGGSYLAGVSGLELGYGMPTYKPEGIAFDRKLPGYWKIPTPARGEWLTPNPIVPRNSDTDHTGEMIWVTTQTLDIAAALGYEFDVAEAYVWEQHARIYDTWYERVRDARTALDTPDPDDQRARDLLKQLYVRTLGLTASFEHHKDRAGFAPERYHLIQARSKANILRRIHQIGTDTGRWPVAISKDTVMYTSDEADPLAAWPGDPKHYGRGLGQYKYEGSALLADHLPFLTGRGRYDGKSSLTDWTESN